MVLGAKTGSMTRGLKLMAVEQSAWSLLKAVFVSVLGKLGTQQVNGLHIQNGDMIRIESERTSVILDGEEFRAVTGRPIVLRSTPPMDFLRLAA
jgi:hypothetical protein